MFHHIHTLLAVVSILVTGVAKLNIDAIRFQCEDLVHFFPNSGKIEGYHPFGERAVVINDTHKLKLCCMSDAVSRKH